MLTFLQFLVKLTQSESSFTLPGIDSTMICTPGLE